MITHARRSRRPRWATAAVLVLATSATVPVQGQDSTTRRRPGAAGAETLPLQTTRTVAFTTTEGTWMSLDVIRVGTLLGAEGIGLGKELGSLEPGKLADLQVLDGNPLADVRNTNTIRYVMKNGRLYDGNTLAEVWPRAKPAEQPWWLPGR